MMHSLKALVGSLLLVGAASSGREGPIAVPADSLPLVQPNDNRAPAGILGGDTLRVALEVRMARWFPEADSGASLVVEAFSEAGRAPQIPAPLIRVRAGTIIVATVRNLLPDSAIWLHGFVSHPASADDSTAVHPGGSITLTFPAGDPGTYLYWATLGASRFVRGAAPEREQLLGAFVVDPAEGSPADRVFVINIWGTPVDSATYFNALTINGKAWPYTERIETAVGDTLRWRVVNGSRRVHPMHLHGFFFRLEDAGDGLRDSMPTGSPEPLLVTKSLSPFATMTMAWSPDRPGNWLFHCHIGYHVTVWARYTPMASMDHDRMAHDPMVHMAGLVLGITVRPPPELADSRGRARRLHLFVQEGTRRGRSPRSMAFVLQEGRRPPAPDSIGKASSVLVLTRNQPTDVVVVNRLKESSAIHWHGLELESYSDGVAGWSGAGSRLAPTIEPGDSFVAHLTLPRAGTFIYHTHMNDIEQMSSGLYGGLVVLEPGQRFNPRRDHLFVTGWDGEDPKLLVNGDSLPAPLILQAGVPHRLRFVNIGVAGRFWYSMYRDSSLAEWRLLARDGADLPKSLSAAEPAVERIDVGETRDVEFTPAPGVYRLVVGDPKDPAWAQEIDARGVLARPPGAP